MLYSFPSTLVLMAALNEEEGIGPTIVELKQFLGVCRILVVDGNSHDKTVHVSKSLGADVIHQVGRGKGDAISQAIRHINEDVKYIVLIDADFTYPAVFIPSMIKILEENPEVGMVCGNRFNSRFHLETMADSFYFGNRAIAFIHNLLNGLELQDPLTGLRVVRWEILKKWNPKSTGFDIEVELNHYVERQGFMIVEIPISYRLRVGEKKLKLRHGFSIFWRIFLEGISS
ncbi:MAG: glycosyltransferase family 2 protein [Candidatus Bathyarchaeota archaeon]|nr:glycosyltransferase family 2 protein [Candidatus Bathyarchaeota archaeon]